jgi:hypothetical protein
MAVAALLAAAACGPRPGDPRPTPPVQVHVTNNNRADVNLYVLRGGTRTRLGTVVSGNTRVLTIGHLPAVGMQQLGFEVQRIGAEGIFSLPRVSVVPGQSIHIRIEDLVTTSEIFVGEES